MEEDLDLFAEVYEHLGKELLNQIDQTVVNTIMGAGDNNINGGRKLLEHHNAIALAYKDLYDAIKYQYITPIKPVTFETHKLKWNFVELFKFFQTNPNGLVPEKEFVDFLTFIYGEGYHVPETNWVSYTHDIRNQIGLAELYRNYTMERTVRYDTLENSLAAMRQTYNIQTLEEFRHFITPRAVGREMPLMWDTIGHSPEMRSMRKYTLSLQSFILLDSYLHLLDKWDGELKGEPDWDDKAKRLKIYRKLYSSLQPINSMLVRKAINSTMKLK